MNNRRKLVIALGAGALIAPLRSFAQQQGKIWRVGFLATRARPASFDTDFLGVFPQAMGELGYVEGKNLMIEWRFADGKSERLPGLAAELVQINVNVIVAGGTAAVGAAQKATTTIPIVMTNSGDPVASGFIKSLAHPGSNITGLSTVTDDLSAKHVEMLLSMVPKLSRMAVLWDPANPAHLPNLKSVQAAGVKTRVTIQPIEARTAQEIENAFSIMVQKNAGAVIVLTDPLFVQQRGQIAELATKYRMPSIFGFREHVEAGGLMSYGASGRDRYRRVAILVDKIFKGAKPRDLPVEQPATFELIINRKTAKTLGLTIPQSLLISAEQVIE